MVSLPRALFPCDVSSPISLRSFHLFTMQTYILAPPGAGYTDSQLQQQQHLWSVIHEAESNAPAAQASYEGPRQRANVAMMGALDVLGRMFKPQSGPLAAVRSLGLDALNAAPPVKQRIMRFAMGWT